MLPDDDHMLRLITKVEQGVHHRGWDKPPFLAILRYRPPTMAFNPVTYDIPDSPGAFLETLATRLSDDTAIAQEFARTVLAKPGFAGMGVVSEAWSSPLTNAEIAGRHLADIPGSVECRVLQILDLTGRSYQVLRLRGKKPLVNRLERLAGRIPASMLVLNKLVAGFMPDADQLLDVLEQAKLYTPDEVDDLVTDLRQNRSEAGQ